MSKETKGKKEYIDDIKIESIDACLKAGIILPRLIPRLNQVYQITINSIDKYFTSDYGKTMTFDIIHDNMDKSLVAPKSFKFQLLVEMIRNKLTTRENIIDDKVDYSVLIGKQLVFQKIIGNTKQLKNVELYTVQIK